MRDCIRMLAVAAAIALPWSAGAQHSHGGGGAEMPPRPARQERLPPPERQRGVLPAGSPRQVEVLVVSYGFSPQVIRADQGEQLVLAIRRSDDSHCKDGVAIPARQVLVQLPVGETVPVTLKLDRAETLEVACANEDVRASIVVAPP